MYNFIIYTIYNAKKEMKVMSPHNSNAKQNIIKMMDYLQPKHIFEAVISETSNITSTQNLIPIFFSFTQHEEKISKKILKYFLARDLCHLLQICQMLYNLEIFHTISIFLKSTIFFLLSCLFQIVNFKNKYFFF